MTSGIQKSVDLKGNRYTMMSVVLSSVDNSIDLELIKRDLAERVLQAPAFFQHTPVIVDFSSIEITEEFDFNALFKIVRQHSLLPVAVKGVADEIRERLQKAGVPIVEQSGSAAKGDSEDKAKLPAGRIEGEPGTTLVVDQPIKAGQQCVAQEGDLVVLATVSHTAELVADGNIHVYGALRGRVLCGVRGNTDARIFCTSLEARLVSVAGRYKILQKIPAAIKNRPVQIRLKGEKLLVEPLPSPR